MTKQKQVKGTSTGSEYQYMRYYGQTISGVKMKLFVCVVKDFKSQNKHGMHATITQGNVLELTGYKFNWNTVVAEYFICNGWITPPEAVEMIFAEDIIAAKKYFSSNLDVEIVDFKHTPTESKE